MVGTLKKYFTAFGLGVTLAFGTPAVEKSLEGILLEETIPQAEAASSMNPDTNPTASDFIAVAGINVISGGIISGIGSYINDKGFWRGFLLGSLGGIIGFSGKFIATSPHHPFPLLGKLTHSFGASIISNAGKGENPLEQYEIDIGPLYLTMPMMGNNSRFRIEVMPLPLAGIIYNVGDGASFDVKNSLLFLTPVFKISKTKVVTGYNANSFNAGNVITYLSECGEECNSEFFDTGRSIRHEYVHALQYREGLYGIGPTFLIPLENRIKGDTLFKYLRFTNDILNGLQYLYEYPLYHNYRPREFEAINIKFPVEHLR